MSVKATWSFNINFLTNGVKVSTSTSGTDRYQVEVPVNAKKLVFQISRQVPGGFPIAYIAQGSMPSPANFQWKADTSQQSYISITINDPNPAGSSSPNPGNYIFAITASTQSGYIIQADWQ